MATDRKKVTYSQVLYELNQQDPETAPIWSPSEALTYRLLGLFFLGVIFISGIWLVTQAEGVGKTILGTFLPILAIAVGIRTFRKSENRYPLKALQIYFQHRFFR